MKKYIFILALVCCSSYICAEELLGNKAPQDPTWQDRAYAPGEGYVFQVGDTIVINKSVTHYLTGEEPSKWVYNVRHQIGQIGGKRFPEGIFLRGIVSWVGPNDIMLVGQPQQEEEQKQEPAPVVVPVPVQQPQPAAQTQPVAEQQPVVEQTPVEPVVDEQPVEEPVEQPVEPVEEVHPDKAVIVSQPEAHYAVDGNPERKTVDRFTIGVRGGVASLLHSTINDSKWNAGWDALLDLQYAHYWQKTDDKPLLGLLVGISAGYSRSHLSGAVNDQYSVQTSSGQIDYNITADNVKEYDGQIQLEVPIMFSMIHKGFFLNAGPRLAMPVYSNYNQEIKNPNVNAYFPTEGVNVSNEVITGLVRKEQAETSGKWNASKINVMLSAELGYEWTFKNLNSLGLGVYANYSVYTYYTNDTQDKSLVSVSKPDAAAPSVVDVVSATDTYADGLGYFDVGIKLAYHFNWWKQK